MAKPSRNTIILGGLAVVAALGWLTWNRLQPAGLPTGFTSANGRIEATEVDIAALTGGRIAAINAAPVSLPAVKLLILAARKVFRSFNASVSIPIAA